MWLLICLFFLVIFFVGWNMFGYFILLRCIGIFRKEDLPATPSRMPGIYMVVPLLNEEGRVREKIENIRKIRYPENLLEVCFVDGGSTDRTRQLLAEAPALPCAYTLICSPRQGKIAQINYALDRARSDIVVVSDADADLDPDALSAIAIEFSRSPDIAVVGACSWPPDTIPVESYYWSAQNKGRLIESQAFSASNVIAQCYAFRRELIDRFPDDIVADDVYIAFLAHSRNLRTVYSRASLAVETRAPKTMKDFLPHKFRKSNAYLRESLRFLYRLPDMRPYFKMLFLTRVAQQLFLPTGIILLFFVAGSLLSLGRFDVVVLGCVVMAALFTITAFLFSRVQLPYRERRHSIYTMVKGYVLTIFIILATGMSYPFFRQGDNYSRVSSKEVRG